MNSNSRNAVAAARYPSAWAANWGLFAALWRRDLIRLKRERSRWLGVVLQPLLFWAVLGSGMSSVFSVKGVSELNYLTYFFPGVVAMVVLFTAIFATMSVIEDRQSGFLQQAMVVPGARAAMVLGKCGGVTTVSLVQALLCVVAAPLAGFDLLAIHWPMLILVLVLGSFGLTAINFAMAWVISSTSGYHAIMSVVLMPMWMLSGAMYPASSGWTEVVMRLNPMAYLVDGIRHALDGGTSRVATASPSFSLLVLALFCAPALALAIWTVKARAHEGRGG
jgi:ABC-2 type transport system permease protein